MSQIPYSTEMLDAEASGMDEAPQETESHDLELDDDYVIDEEYVWETQAFGMEGGTPLETQGESENSASADADAVSDFDEEEDEDYDEESEESDEEQLTYAAYIRMEVPRTNYNSFGVEYETKDGRLVPAVFHHQIRDDLILIARAQGTYTHEPTRGAYNSDVTAFHPDQKDWEEKGAGRPELLKIFSKPADFVKSTYVLGYMYFANCLVIDFRGLPIRPFTGLPLTLSSKIEGWRVEAFRRADPRISHEDLAARMCVKIEYAADGQQVQIPFARKGAISAKSRRYRESSGTVTWEGREGSEKLREYFWSLLPQHCKDNNLAMPRDLTEAEKAQVATINLGKYPKRARKTPAQGTPAQGSGRPRKRMTTEQYVQGIRNRAAAAMDKEARSEKKTRRRKAASKSKTTEPTAEAPPVDGSDIPDREQDFVDLIDNADPSQEYLE